MTSAHASDNREPEMASPERSRGGDLIWWRESASCHTAVTLWGGIEDLGRLGPSISGETSLHFRLHDAAGELRSTWMQTVSPGQPVTVDSRDHARIVDEGV